MTTIDTLEALEQHLNTANETLLVFKSDNCIDCDFLDTYIDTIEHRFPEITFLEVKRHQLPEIFNHYRIYGVPSFFYFHKGNIINKYVDKKRKYPENLIMFIETSRKGVDHAIL